MAFCLRHDDGVTNYVFSNKTSQEVNPCFQAKPKPLLKDYYEKKFQSMLGGLGGSYQIKMKHSNLLLPYLMIKMECQTTRYKYNTIIVGDERDEEDEARENAFQKAVYALQGRFKQEVITLGRDSRRRTSSLDASG